ncbi:MAG: Ppx/GppA phosphatase family protein [Gammaproteobacteria bacterium]|nr:Ppx/GppA phosphatase family protein [Gammaproteobacteria bacterium]
MQLNSESPYFAAVDLGSNSFHMVIARIQNGQMEIIDREKEMVQIARGVKKDGHLNLAAQTRALDCLHRFSERLRDIPVEQIRAVGTKSLRATSRSKSFIKKAERTLGAPIQIISGFEEARLVYAGLSHSVLNDHNRRLVVDIGGGSTEFIIGEGFEPLLMESLSMGCVSYTKRYANPAGKITRKFIDRVYLAACSEIEVLRKNYLKVNWQIVFGTSGTARAIADLTAEKNGGAVINKNSLDQLINDLLKDKKLLNNVPELRRDVLPAGIVILKAVFDQLKLDSLHVGDAALKEGLLFDTIGRLSDKDTRDETIEKLQQQYNVDTDHAQNVAETAVALWQKIQSPVLPGVSRSRILSWAAELHEIGLSISHTSFHHHGYYIIRHNDMAGFGRYEQYILANLVCSHRKGLYQQKFGDMDELAMAAFVPLLVCLRLAVLFHRRREDMDYLPKLNNTKLGYQLKFRRGWLKQNPLTLAGLEQEKEQYESIGVALEFS